MEVTYNIRLDGIQVVEKLLFKANIVDTDQFHFDIKSQSLVDHDKKLIIIVIQVKIFKNQETNQVAQFVIALAYAIQEFDSIVKRDDNTHTIPLELENLLKSITLSTMRGIMFSELRGTHLNNAVLPVVSIDSFKPMEGSLVEITKDK